jgi:hypothetical protein
VLAACAGLMTPMATATAMALTRININILPNGPFSRS